MCVVKCLSSAPNGPVIRLPNSNSCQLAIRLPYMLFQILVEMQSSAAVDSLRMMVCLCIRIC